jgi:hypothetical protein
VKKYKNYMITLARQEDTASAMMTKTYSEAFRGVERIEWQPHHVVFYFGDGQVAAVRADRVIELVSFEE